MTKPDSPARPAAPVQKRSRERYETILACAMAIMAEKGSEAFRMSDIVERAGVPFGSLYQYFPDKTAIVATLAERYNAVGRDCVAKALSGLRDRQDIHAVLCAITDDYYDFFLREPIVRHIWQATQADRALQAIDEADGRYLTGLLVDALGVAVPEVPARARDYFAQMVLVQIAAAVRHAITLPPRDAHRALAVFKKMLPHDIVV